MKTRRIASSIALAAALALGATGCSMIAPQGTTHPYAPSDGIDVTIEQVALRNLLLVADESGDNFNVVFAGVNNTTEQQIVSMTFSHESTQATADFLLAPGLTSFGNPKGEIAPTLVSLPGLKAGATVEVYFEVAGGGEAKFEVPVLDGTLGEYQDYVLSLSDLRKMERDAKADKKDAADDAATPKDAAKTPETNEAPAAE